MDSTLNGSILMQTVSNVIADFTGQNKVFTAFDVTQKIRGDGVLSNVRHSEVKEMVFQDWKDTFCDDYESTLTELKIGDKTMNAYVYHPVNISPTTHPLAVVEENEEIEENEEVEIDDISTSYVTVDLTASEKRLSIPKGMLAAIGLKAGHIVYLDVSDSRKIVIRKDEDSHFKMPFYSINTDGRLRISKPVLDKIFKQDICKYNIYVITNKSVIEVIPA
jgi:bifunctional DNA-binding transcriptional regulator/antitoxin component of YhaV-PrlF toxin-antitoxin module